MKQEKIQTFLTKDLQYKDCMVGGIKYEMQSVEENEDNDFNFEECATMFIQGHGEVYRFFDFCYVIDGFTWYRFLYSDLILISN